jgi:YD repeat-containing protein
VAPGLEGEKVPGTDLVALNTRRDHRKRKPTHAWIGLRLQIASLSHAWNGSALTLTYSYNQDQQRSGLTASDATFLPSGLSPMSATYTPNVLNQYSSVTGTLYTYDKRGNLTSDGVFTYGYNTENQLISASKTGFAATYSYDPFGRRKWKTVNNVTTAWVLFGNQEIAEYQGSGTISLTRRFVYGPCLRGEIAASQDNEALPPTSRIFGVGADEPIASISSVNARTFQFHDALGSVIALANASGLVTEK